MEIHTILSEVVLPELAGKLLNKLIHCTIEMLNLSPVITKKKEVNKTAIPIKSSHKNKN
jgi:hypothetical protein